MTAFEELEPMLSKKRMKEDGTLALLKQELCLKFNTQGSLSFPFLKKILKALLF